MNFQSLKSVRDKFQISNFKFPINKLILGVIIILALVLRLWQLDKFPGGLNADEAAIGYNAYSLIQTGMDEYGTSFPLVFKSFGDYKPGLYFYFVIPFVSLMGLNEWSVRLPSALLGVGTVFVIYLLGRKIFNSEYVGLLSAFFLAISPWHLHFSRGGWETNAATFFICFGVYLLIRNLNDLSNLGLGFLSLLVSMYLYQSPRLVVPILVLCYLIIFYKDLWVVFIKNRLRSIVYASILLVLLLPIVLQFTFGGGSERFEGLSFLADKGPENRANELRGEHGGNTPSAKIFHNKLTVYGLDFVGHYLDHFNPNFLFINGDTIDRNKVPEVGQFYLIFSLFLVSGAIGLIISQNVKKEHKRVLIVWILVAPLASSLTYQTPNAVRALSMVVPFILLMAYGGWQIVRYLNRIKFGGLVTLVLTLFLIFEFGHYLESYYVHLPKRYPLATQYGFDQMVEKLIILEDKYDKVVITDRYDQPYILVLFYKKYDPLKYQSQALLSPRDKFNFGTVRSFDKYEFREIKPEEVNTAKNTLFIGTQKELPKDRSIIDEVVFPNGESAFLFIGT